MNRFLRSTLIVVVMIAVMGVIAAGLYHWVQHNASGNLPVESGFGRHRNFNNQTGQAVVNPEAESVLTHGSHGGGGENHVELDPLRGLVGILRNLFLIILITLVVSGIQSLVRIKRTLPQRLHLS